MAELDGLATNALPVVATGGSSFGIFGVIGGVAFALNATTKYCPATAGVPLAPGFPRPVASGFPRLEYPCGEVWHFAGHTFTSWLQAATFFAFPCALLVLGVWAIVFIAHVWSGSSSS